MLSWRTRASPLNSAANDSQRKQPFIFWRPEFMSSLLIHQESIASTPTRTRASKITGCFTTEGRKFHLIIGWEVEKLPMLFFIILSSTDRYLSDCFCNCSLFDLLWRNKNEKNNRVETGRVFLA